MYNLEREWGGEGGEGERQSCRPILKKERKTEENTFKTSIEDSRFTNKLYLSMKVKSINQIMNKSGLSVNIRGSFTFTFHFMFTKLSIAKFCLEFSLT